MSNTILVTGASGNIGRELVNRLQVAGANVIAGSSRAGAVGSAPTRRVDLLDPASLQEAFAGIDTLFLLQPLESRMVTMVRNAVAAAKAAGVRHIVRSSGAGADRESPASIGRVHGEADQLVIDSGIPYTIVRPTSFMQNYIHFFGAMIREGGLYVAQGDGKTSLIDVRDIAEIAANILKNPASHAGKVYTLTGAEALGNADVAAIIGTAIGRKVVYVAVPDSAAIEAMRGMGMDDWTIDVLTSLNHMVAAGHAGISPDTAALLGHAPIAFRQFADENVAAWQ